MSSLKEYIDALIDVFYPVLCISCDNRCDQSNELFCFRCQAIQAPTDLHLREKNEFTDHFIGRIPIHTAASLYYYSPGGIIHQLLEQIKYRSKPQIAERIGHYYGAMLKESQFYHKIDLVIPVPLHPFKLAKRGYNQSEVLAKAIAEVLGKEFKSNILKRVINSSSQTAKSRVERLNNILNAYSMNDEVQIKNRNILLIDDVMTTGSTLEACSLELLKGEPQTISFVTIAMGK